MWPIARVGFNPLGKRSHNSDAAAPNAKGILQVGESFLRRGVSTVCDEPIGLKSRTYELVWVPPETGEEVEQQAQDTFIQTI